MHSCLLLLLLVTIPLVTNGRENGGVRENSRLRTELKNEASGKRGLESPSGVRENSRLRTELKKEASGKRGLESPKSNAMLDTLELLCYSSGDNYNLNCSIPSDEGDFSTLSCFQTASYYMYGQEKLRLRCGGKSPDGHVMLDERELLCYKVSDLYSVYGGFHLRCNQGPGQVMEGEGNDMLDTLELLCYSSGDNYNLNCSMASDEGDFPEESTLSCFQTPSYYMYGQEKLGLRCGGKLPDGHGMLDERELRCYRASDRYSVYGGLHLRCNQGPGQVMEGESYGMLDAFKVSCHPSELNLQCFTAADEGTFPEGSTLSCFRTSDDYMYIQATLGLRCDGKSPDGHGMLCHKTTDEDDSYDEPHLLCNLNPVKS